MTHKLLQELSNEELWRLFPIILSEPQDRWSEEYISEQNGIVTVIGCSNITRINHIGSTSVPNLVAKPTIDILVEVKNEIDIGTVINNLENRGYIYSPQPNNPPPHMMFLKGYTTEGFKGQTFHVHIRYAGDWDELYFRDYLKVHPETATEYGMLKLSLKKRYEYDRDSYTEAKSNFICRINALARQEFDGRYVNAANAMDKFNKL